MGHQHAAPAHLLEGALRVSEPPVREPERVPQSARLGCDPQCLLETAYRQFVLRLLEEQSADSAVSRGAIGIECEGPVVRGPRIGLAVEFEECISQCHPPGEKRRVEVDGALEGRDRVRHPWAGTKNVSAEVWPARVGRSASLCHFVGGEGRQSQ